MQEQNGTHGGKVMYFLRLIFSFLFDRSLTKYGSIYCHACRCLLWNDGVVSFCLFNFLRQKIDNSLLKTKNKNVGRRIAVIHPSIGLYATFLFLFFGVICDILLKNPQQHGIYFLNWQYLLLQWSLHYLIQRVIKWWKGSPLWN